IAVTIGKTAPSFSVEGLVKVRKHTRDWTQNNTGVKLLNMNEAVLTIDARLFTNNVVLEGNGNGCAYNEITFKKVYDGKKNLSFIVSNGGWVNENKLYGGRFYWRSGLVDKERWHINIPDITMNNNTF